ncbi:P pilus assembly chaperone PapD [Herbaspirillum rubrisubalbicans]|uniref:fimbrial biogenesis chaperone n=1 Tax=Herbaspirillum rubrisubalbicans TaxID=80842 RepID=UPI0020A04387|nr:fimbria/pilus periplasmic chaperone [Herbaspirillum rubrisubalbicans]MCP1576964.1 P pilus assembly chaperone PapD [Herbaspirillum rubrisubalbicans]
MKTLTACLWLLMSLCGITEAGVMPERTRLVLSQGSADISLRLANTNAYPVLVQSWVDRGEGNLAPDTVLSSMFVMPAVLRLQPHDISQIRVLYTGDSLPADRESVFWLNLYEIPLLRPDQPQEAARLLLGLNTQIKVFYRTRIVAAGFTVAHRIALPPGNASAAMGARMPQR